MSMHRFLNSLFEGHTHASLQLLKKYGGINSLLRELQQHREHESALRQSKDHPFIQLTLLSLATLSLLLKLLFITNGILPQNTQIIGQIISIPFLLLIIFFLKKYPIYQQKTTTKPESSKDQLTNLWTIEKDEGLQKVEQKDISVGDVLFIDEKQLLPADGILLRVEKGPNQNDPCDHILVSEDRLGPSDVQVIKQCLEDNDPNDELDPFLHAGTKIDIGQGWMLVCRTHSISQNQTKNEDKPLGVSEKITLVMRTVLVLPVLVLLLKWKINPLMMLQLISVVAILVLYLSLMDESEGLEMLRMNLKSGITSPYLTLSHVGAIQRCQLLVIEDRLRGGLEYISLLNQFQDVKVISQKNSTQIEKQFAQELNKQVVFLEDQTQPLKRQTALLMQAKFVSTSFKAFAANYLPLLEQMGFTILLVSAQIHNQPVIELCKESSRVELARIKSASKTPEALLEFQIHTLKSDRLVACFMAIRTNQCVQFAILVGWACFGTAIDFNLGLILFCINRLAFHKLLQNWLKSPKGWGRGNLNWKQINLLLLPFFLFLTFKVSAGQKDSSLLFLIILANRLFRTELMEPVVQMSVYGAKCVCLLVTMGIVQIEIVRSQGQGWGVKEEWVGVMMMPLIVWLCRRFQLSIQ